MNETGPEVKAPREAQCKQARPHDELVAEILDSRRLKTEREHAASREIDRLRQLLRAEGTHLENVKAAWQAKVDALGLAITNASYPWTPEMRTAYEILPDAKVGDGDTAIEADVEIEVGNITEELHELRRQLEQERQDHREHIAKLQKIAAQQIDRAHKRSVSVTREMIGAAHDVMLAKGDFVLSANLLERIYRAMRAREPKEGDAPIVGAGETAKTEIKK